MKSECAKFILKLIPNQVMWCDRVTLQNILQLEQHELLEIDQAIRYLVRKQLLVQLMVNLPSRAAIAKINESELGRPDPALMRSHENAFRMAVSLPIEMIGPTKHWAGICGCNYRVPNCHAEWIAHLRLSVALSSNIARKQKTNDVTDSSSLPAQPDAVVFEMHAGQPIAASVLKKHMRLLGARFSSKGGEDENR